MKDKPSEWKWGASSEYGWNPVYDFDNVKLWSFLCAYYYDFDVSDNGDIKYWKFNNAAKTAVEELFKDEYEFVYRYDKTSRWEYKYKFDARGYYSIDGSGTSGSYGYMHRTSLMVCSAIHLPL